MSIEQTYELVAVDQLTEYPGNPRRGDVDAIAAAIAKDGWHGAITAQVSTRHVIAGNHRLQAARLLGMAEVPVLWLDCDDDTARRKVLADNRATDLGYFDEEALAAALVSAGDLAGTLFSEADLELLAVPLPDEQEEGDPMFAMRVNQPAGSVTQDYQAVGTRSVVLTYPMEDYVELTDALRVMRSGRGLATNSEVVAALIREEAARGE